MKHSQEMVLTISLVRLDFVAKFGNGCMYIKYYRGKLVKGFVFTEFLRIVRALF